MDFVTIRSNRCPLLTLYYHMSVVGCFFSSRRRHTSWPRDWSSDVCSSDLGVSSSASISTTVSKTAPSSVGKVFQYSTALSQSRSEERRVGKECRATWRPGNEQCGSERTTA